MNNDLISREALKETLSSKDLITWTYEYGDAIPIDWLMSTIDNAPTVPLPDFKEGYKQAIIDGKTNFSRPQGEWIIEHLPKNINNPDDCYECVSCSECGFHYDYMFCNSNYCPNCGADMRKGEEK